LPLLTLADLLGVPFDLWPKLYEWTNAFVGEDDPDFRASPEAMAAVLGDFFAFAQDLFDRRRAEPGCDIASLLANATIEGRPIAFGEFVANLILVLVGGNETTRNSLSHAMVAFAAHPEQWDWLREDPDRLRTAVREMVRHASPVMHMRRTATADTRIGDQPVATGDKVVLWYVSGNRDEAVFDHPERFDVTRTSVPHLGFGAGQHVCVGWRLAELQLRVAFGRLAGQVRRFEQVGQPRRFRSNFINGLKNLDLVMVPV
jgi:linalool 8-monooxygenase